jgi:diadenylate cyclase
MADSFINFILQLVYLFTHMTFSNVVDITLVASVFFILFQSLYQTRALQLLRGVIIIAILGATLLVLLPLDTLNWLVTISLLAGVIALPLLFQDELRRALTGLGKIPRRRGYGSRFESFKETIIEAVSVLSGRQDGALIVLEGETPLDDVIETGIPLQAEVVTTELLETIFQYKTPLHDGAVILRGDCLMAASCILPVLTESTGYKHLGTRHRAALGLATKVPDALVIVVSEETGRISVALSGRFYRGLNSKQLEYWIDHFQTQFTGEKQTRWGWLKGGGWRSTITNLLMSIMLALVAWLSVIFQTNPPGQLTIQGVPLVVTGPGSGLVLMEEPPETVRVQVQATQDRIDALDPSSARAELALSELSAGVHNVPVQVDLADRFAQVLSISPSHINVTLEPELNSVITPTVEIVDIETLPPGYVVGEVSLSPESVIASGLKSQVEKIVGAKIELTLDGRRTDFQESIPAVMLDDFGERIFDVKPIPEKVLVTVSMERTYFTREIPIRADVDKSDLDKDYEVTDIAVFPDSVTITGSQFALEEAGEFLVTSPISLTNVYSEFTTDAPLVLPDGVSAFDEEGESITNVTVRVIVQPVTDYLVIDSRVNLTGLSSGLTARVAPTRASVLLIGPRPLLDEIFVDSSLVSVFVDLSGLDVGTYTLPLQVQVPEGVQTQLFPTEVEVIIDETLEGS